MNLYQIDNRLASILDDPANESGELTEDQVRLLDALAINRVELIDSLLKSVANHKGRAVGIQAELDRLKAQKDAEDAGVDRIKKYIFNSMRQHNEQKLQTPLHSLRIQRNGGVPSVTIDTPIGNLPVAFLRIPPPEPDKAKIIEAWNAWMAKQPLEVGMGYADDAAYTAWERSCPLPEFVKVERGYHLQFK
jgi:Siphovirus Gp157